MSYCKYCGEAIEWIHAPDGKMVPIDPEPVFIVEDGSPDTFFLEDGQPVITGRVARPEEESRDLEVGYIPHARTCKYWADKPTRRRTE